jgi:DNA-binding beta-propeller fold protein YncE/mono/diheme cytochrome c family protein
MGARSLATVTLLPLLAIAAATGLASTSEARRMPVDQFDHFDQLMIEPIGDFGFVLPQFRLEDLPLGGQRAPALAPHAGSHGGTLSVDRDGVLVLDRESGKLLRTDRDGNVLASLQFDVMPGELVSDGKGSSFVADRRANKLVHVRSSGTTLSVIGSAKLREPHGLALSPDGKTVYATSVADHVLVAIDTQTLLERWRIELPTEPRAVAVSPDGRHALVGFLSNGVIANVELGSTPSVSYMTLDPAQRVSNDGFGGFQSELGPQQIANNLADGGQPIASIADVKDIGLRFARNTFAIGYVGDGLAIAPHQISSPHLPTTGFEDAGTYGGGGGFLAPITHRMAMIDAEDSFAPELAFAQIGVHQPRALAYDAGTDTLYLAGYGNDVVMAVAEVSQASIHLSWSAAVPSTTGCGPDGLAVDGGVLLVHCELAQTLVGMELASVEISGMPSSQQLGTALATSPRSFDAQRGAELFRRGQDPRLSSGGFMACASCHPEGRTDGLSWRIEGHNLQTPLLAGRLAGTHPFKWDGKDHDLLTSLTNTIGRLGGSGLTPDEVRMLEAFLQSLPQPEAPTIHDADAVARGRLVFESEQTGCLACHDGPRLADGSQHDLKTNIGAVDTPSLIGLAHSAPYYHDGSARTLRALLTDKGSIHDMGNTATLDAAQLDDLIAYLESL